MKKSLKVQLISIILLLALLLTACNDSGATKTQPPHTHSWVDATCAAPKTCSGCGATEGEALAHTWTEATYAAPKTCTVCGATEGEALESPIPENLNLALQIDKIPVATPDMTEDELRDIILQFMYLQINFAFTPVYSDRDEYGYHIKNLYSKYKASQNIDNIKIMYNEGKYYGGIPYMGNSGGSLYRWLEYYDPYTGEMDWDPIVRTRRENWVDASNGRIFPDVGSSYFGNTCASSCVWAWSRVSDQLQAFWTYNCVPMYGYVKVGDYELEEDGTHGTSTKTLCLKNGKDKMFDCYALVKRADGFVQSGHAAMAVADAVVVRDANGKIDGEKSYVRIAEQKASFLTASPTEGGVDLYSPLGNKGLTYRIMGNYAGNKVNGNVKDMKWTFNYLYENGYMPFTIPELCGQNPVEKAKAGLRLNDKNVSGTSIKASDIENMIIKCNYPISDVHFNVLDEAGNEVFSAMYAKRTEDNENKNSGLAALKEYTLDIALNDNVLFEDKGIIKKTLLEYAAKGNYKIEITARVSTGELLTLYKGGLAQ